VTAPGLAALLDLQDLDATLDRLRHRRAHLPERAELAALHARVADTEARRAAVVAVRDEVAAREQALEDELRATEARAGEVDRRLYGGQVSASRDLQAMAGDVASLRARASDLEDRALAVLEEREPLDAEVAERDDELRRLSADATALAVRVEEADTAVMAEMAEAEARRSAVAAAVPAGLMPEYDRLRARLGGVAAARLVGSRCDGCHLTLPATELDEIRRQPPDAVVNCDNCGRILIRP
jgi:predicted  nucleic acid-binding Zn-ribbon protein